MIVIPKVNLPVLEIADQVNSTLFSKGRLVVTAPPGAGKSTLLPLTILRGLDHGTGPTAGRILMLEPRRLAARQVAERMASLLGEEVGQTVGYRVRFETKVSARTRIEVLTEGILTRMLVSDPGLEGVDVVIFDEFHERSLNSDLALALTRESMDLLRPDLKILIMSATIDAAAICQALDAPLLESDGRMYPVTTIQCPEADAANVAESVAHIIRQAHRENEGDILAFLPGEAEIRRCAELLGTALGATMVLPLYGMLSPAAQKAAIAPSLPGQRKVVLATPIAETSITIEGVRSVVDPGLCKKMVFNPQNSLSHLETVRISKDMARQRAGRAGRTAPGSCYQLWSSATASRMEECRRPEILEADLSSMVLDIAAWGESHPERLQWLTPPPAASLAHASELLRLLGAIDDDGKITPHGKDLSALPCHPRIAQMLVMAASATGTHPNPAEAAVALAADIAAILEEKDPLSQTEKSSDISIRISELRKARRREGDRKGSGRDRRWSRIAAVAQQYRALAGGAGRRHSGTPGGFAESVGAQHKGTPGGFAWGVPEDNSDPDAFAAGLLLAGAYPERIGHEMKDSFGRYQLSCGDFATVDSSDDMSAHGWLVAADLSLGGGAYVNARAGTSASSRNGTGSGVGRIFLAAPVDPKDLLPMASTFENISWDSREGRVVARKEWRIGRLIVDSRPISEGNRDRMMEVICEAARKEGTSMFDFSDAVGNLQRRVAAVGAWHHDLEIPDLSTEAVLERASEWVPLYLGKAVSKAEMKKIDMCQVLWGLLSYEQQCAVDSLAPTHIRVPSGIRIRVEYRQGAEAPVLRVRLQECFGLLETPCVDNGSRPVLMELLSPGFKPVQLTQDLRSFWQGTYFEVRKELRRRYPKHAWPEDPTVPLPPRPRPSDK
ncbi:MAG: ATP-dependent helicase HrpB [Bacteroidales bacterium]|nr:ATP-dependent helicase HrpB [Bacteroidales bacterium]